MGEEGAVPDGVVPMFPTDFGASFLYYLVTSFAPSQYFSDSSSIRTIGETVTSLVFISFSIATSLASSPDLLGSLFDAFSMSSTLSFDFFSGSTPIYGELLVGHSFRPSVLPTIQIYGTSATSHRPSGLGSRVYRYLGRVLAIFCLSNAMGRVGPPYGTLDGHLFHFQRIVERYRHPTILQNVQIVRPMVIVRRHLPNVGSQPIYTIVMQLRTFSTL